MRRARALRALVLTAACAPLAALLLDAWRGGLGANPIEAITHRTGVWALRFLLLSLAISPLRRLTGWNAIISYRRSFGLLAFFYASLHLATWAGLDLFFDGEAMREDIVKRRFVTAGMTAYAAMLPLALTSTRGWIRRLGKRWTRLHRLAYVAGLAAVTHYVWLAKGDRPQPRYYAALLVVLLLSRVVLFKRRSAG
jgi:sulfoxide reductase heme-binding subunit YedZ